MAGSERVKKTGVGGKILAEACAINVSLHYLEQVIVALHEQAAGKSTHIPYRNSMLTSVLRASLGGSCRTVMVATLSPEKGHMDESISTSRFATRVAMIKNRALLNEELDPYELVKKLKGQMRSLREELAVARGDAGAKWRPLDEEERRECHALVAAFLRDDRDATRFDEDGSGTFLALPMPNPFRVRACFDAFKQAYLGQGRSAALDANLVPVAGPAGAVTLAGADGQAVHAAAAAAVVQEITRLQRENQVLADALRKHAGSAATDALLDDLRKRPRGSEGPPVAAMAPAPGPGSRDRERDRDRESEREREQAQRARDRGESGRAAPSTAGSAAAPAAAAAAAPPAPTAAELALARARAESFETFRRSYRKHQLIEEQKATHAAKVEVARRTGESINAIRNEINAAKTRIEAHRLARGLATLGSGGGDEDAPDAQAPDAVEQALRQRIEALKQDYRAQFEGLKALKTEIDFLKRVVEKARAQLQADFERWWATQPQAMEAAQVQAQIDSASDAQQQQRSSSQAVSEGQASARSRPEYPPAPAPRIMADSAAAVAAASQSQSQSQRDYRSSTRPPAEAWGSAAPSSSSSSSSSSAARAAAAVASVPINAWSSSGGGSGYPSSSPPPADAPIPGGLRTTGNSSADADIARFYALKEEMMRQRQQQQQQQPQR